MKTNRFTEKLAAGRPAFGTHISLGENVISELFGGVGYDYLWIDTEHTTISLSEVRSHLIAARASGAAAFVRVPSNDPIRVKPLLEMGPDGIIFPQVNSRAEALAAIDACMYPPKGHRGFGPNRAVGFGLTPVNDYIDTVDGDLLRLLQCENIGAVRELDGILAVPGVSGIIIGPCDLAASMGHIKDPFCDEMNAVIDGVIAKCRAAGVPVGLSIGMQTAEELAAWHRRGLDFLSVGGDTQWMLSGAAAMLADMRAGFGEA